MRRAALLTILALLAGGDAAAQGNQAVPAGTVTIAGKVRDINGRPLESAEIRIEGRYVLTNRDGSFVFTGATPDTIPVLIRRIGYEPEEALLAAKAGDRVEVAIRLTPVPITLGTIVVEGKRMELPLFKNGFYERQKMGIGAFFDPEYLQGHGSSLSGLMKEVPGLDVSRDMQNRAVLLGKVGAMNCVMNVFLDGMLVRYATEIGLDQLTAMQDVIAVEVYQRPEQVPGTLTNSRAIDGGVGQETPKGQMAGTGTRSGDCGAVMIWTTGSSTRRTR